MYSDHGTEFNLLYTISFIFQTAEKNILFLYVLFSRPFVVQRMKRI